MLGDEGVDALPLSEDTMIFCTTKYVKILFNAVKNKMTFGIHYLHRVKT